MEYWPVVFGMLVVTYSARLSVIAWLGDQALPPAATRALRFVPPVVLSAIIFPELLRPAGALDLSLGNARLLAGIAAAVVAWRSRNTILSIAIGMGLLWLLQGNFASLF